MPAFRLLNAFPVYLDNAGQPASGGYLRFYEAGTTDDKAVYSDKALTQSAGSRVDIESDGRTAIEVWGDGSYYVRLYDAAGVMIAEADNVEVAGGTGATIPELVDGYFLTNSGGLLLWAPVLQVPDPTGQSGKVLGSDGANLSWVAAPTAPELPPSEITTAAGSFRAGTHFVQWGTGTCPASGGNSASTAITFGTAFSSVQVALIQISTALVNGIAGASTGVTNLSNTGFTANFDIADRHSYNSFLSQAIPFYWVAIGTKAA